MDPVEYERRRLFVDSMKKMGRSEYVEIARILRRAGITLSENRSGLFFDMAKIPQEVFNEFLKFHEFVEQNNKELGKRDELMTELKADNHIVE